MSITDSAVKKLNEGLEEARAEFARVEDAFTKALKALDADTKKATKGRRGRPKGSTNKATGKPLKKGGRAEQVLELIKEFPGIRVAEIADILKMNPSAVSQIVTKLNKQKLVKKDGRKISAV